MTEITAPDPAALQLEEGRPSPEQIQGMPLPPVEPGFVRLYRGDVIDLEGSPVIENVKDRDTAFATVGRWFTHDPNAAEGYAGGRIFDHDHERMRFRFTDIPIADAEKYNTFNLPLDVMRGANGTGGSRDEWLLPKELADQAREYHVAPTDRLYDPETEASLQLIFSDPGVTEFIKELGVDETSLPEVLSSPAQTRNALHQLSMSLGQNHFKTADNEAIGAAIAHAYIGAGSAHKQRLLGRGADDLHRLPQESPETGPAQSPAPQDTYEW